MKYTAWMLRNDGKAFGLTQHIYGDPETSKAGAIEECLAAAVWLYDYTTKPETRRLAINTMVSWGYTLPDSEENVVEAMLKEIPTRPYQFIPVDFVNNHGNELMSGKPGNIHDLCKQVCDELNQEFCRVRFGGMYNTMPNSKELIFRISSIGFNWYNLIWQFAYDMKAVANCITIVRDFEATGSNKYYSNSKGEPYMQMPLESFFTEKGNPVVEALSVYATTSIDDNNKLHIVENLSKGCSIQSLKKLPINESRLNTKLSIMAYEENNNHKLISSYDV